MIRRLLLILFLYLLLVWTLSYLYASATLAQTAMFWSAMGVAVLLAGLIGERLWAWWRTRRVKPAVTTAPAERRTPPVQSEEEAALTSLIAEADQRLAEAPRQPNSRAPRVADLPLCLVIGPSGAGKTAVMQSCGIEPILLAGQALGPAGAVAPTRVGNIWLAQNSVFVEVAGRVFDGDPARLVSLMNILFGRSKGAGWRSWWKEPHPAADLRGALLVCESSIFVEPEVSRLDRLAQHHRERLGVLARFAGEDLPVYVLLTKADTVRGFPEFFARSGAPDLEQVFGVLTSQPAAAETENRVWAESETKRLNRQFQELILRLDERRRLALSLEGDARRKPAIYEFPREFKKIRTPLVQFLVDVFQPDPLRLGARLTGFFFTGVLAGEAPHAAEQPQTIVPTMGVSEATEIFQPDLTIIQRRPVQGGYATADRDRRAFVAEFFRNVLLRHRPAPIRRAVVLSPFERKQRIATAVACGLSLLLGMAWTVSWLNNRAAAAAIGRAIAGLQKAPADVSLAGLTAIDELRQQLMLLDGSESLARRWGLYRGEELRRIGSMAYFERLKHASLGRIDGTLASQLLGAGADSQVSSDLVYDRLKAYRTISGACAVDQLLVLRVLRASVPQTHPDLGSEQSALLSRQLEYYTSRLRPLPVRLDEIQDAVEKARAYLRQNGGLEQQFRSMLTAVQEKVGRSAPADSLDYQGLMDGPSEISRVFTPKGMATFEEYVANGDPETGKDRCVMGDATGGAQASSKEELKARFYREYAAKWREFLASCKVRPFGSLEDSSRRLAGLTDATKSPLLGVIKLVASNAVVLQSKTETTFLETAKETVKQKVGWKDQEHKADANSQGSATPASLKADLQAKLLQPALFIVPPPFDHTVNDNDVAYVRGLRDLGNAMGSFAHAASADRPAKLQEAQAAAAKAREAQSALADKFSDAGRFGLADPVTELLSQPIRFADALIGANKDTSGGPQKDAELRNLCTRLKPILTSYPFSPGEPTREASLKDLKDAFAPKTGWIWPYAESADFLARQGTEWQEKTSQPLRANPDLVKLLNAAQRLTDAFFTGADPHFQYTLRPCTAHPECDTTQPIKLVLDGKELSPDNVMRVQFHWPAAQGERMGAEALRVFSAGSNGFGNFDSMWGVFRLFQSADPRPLGSDRVVWSRSRGLGTAKPQALDPPVKLDLVGVTPATDVLNPAFFQGLQASSCPTKAVIGN